jgi:hypothetical protein
MPQLEQLAADTLGAPSWILRGHFTNQRATVGRRSTGSPRSSSPEGSECRSMPAEHRRWLDQQSGLTPSWRNSPGEYDCQPLPGTPLDTTDDLALGQNQLPSKEHVLGNEFDTSANKIGQQSRHEPKKVDHL